MTLTEHVLRGAMLEAGDPNRLRVGLPWFRSVPFSALVGLELIVDGRPVPDPRVEVDGRALAVADLAARTGSYWFLQDRHALEWSGEAPAESAEVVLRMRLHLPNLTAPDGSSLQVLQEVRAVVPVERAG